MRIREYFKENEQNITNRIVAKETEIRKGSLKYCTSCFDLYVALQRG